MPDWLQVTDQKGKTVTIKQDEIELLEENEETTIVHLKSGKKISIQTPEEKLSDLILSHEEEDKDEEEQEFFRFHRN